jgi:prevent-host-death family protein
VEVINLHAAKTHFSRLVDEAAAGREIIIAKAGKPVARLMPLESGIRAKRTLGHLRGGRIPEVFDLPLPDDVLDGFEGR